MLYRLLLCGLVMIITATHLQAEGKLHYPFQSAKKEAIFYRTLRELRCLVCQNQSLADSDAELAEDLRAKVYHMVQADQSQSQITAYLVQRYGDFVRYKPPFKANTMLLWLGPLLLLALGCAVLWRVIRSKSC